MRGECAYKQRSARRAELKTALMVDRALVSGDASWVTQPNPAPSLRALSSVALAAGLPFLGFGFLDNAIMVCVHAAILLLPDDEAKGWVCLQRNHPPTVVLYRSSLSCPPARQEDKR